MAKRMSKKTIESAVNSIYRRIGDGVQVPIMSLGSVLDAGAEAFKEGLGEAEAEARMASVLATVRAN